MQVLTQAQAAETLGVTPRRLRQLEEDGAGPPRDADGAYPAREFGEWVRGRGSTGDKERLLRAQADKAEFEAAELRDELVRLSDVVRHFRDALVTFRTMLTSLPTIVAPQVAAPGRAAEAQAILRTNINAALHELADGLERYAVSSGAVGMLAPVAAPAGPDDKPVGGSE